MAYTPTEWKDGDIITAEKMNNLEQAVVEVSNKEGFELSDRIAKGVDDNGNVVEGAVIEGLLTDVPSGSSKNKASGWYSHAEGYGSTASNLASHAEGYGSTASGACSHASGKDTIANHKSQYVFGEYNIEDSSTAQNYDRGTYVEIVGNGTGKDSLSNARTLDWYGNEWIKGSYSANGSLTLGKGTADEVTITAAQLKQLLAMLS